MIPDYPGFIAGKHVYAIATAGGDGWDVSGPLAAALQADMDVNEYEGDVNDWVDSLSVWEGEETIAVWYKGAWRTL